MIVEYNSNNIVVSYLIEFLKRHPFPSYHILSDNPVEGIKYLKDNDVVQLINGKLKTISSYNTLNAERRFNIKSIKYTSYMHKYLGDYLRYFRDTSKIDLMPLYNCYANEKLSIDSDRYQYFVVPVKAGKTYTVSANVNSSFNIYLETELKITNKIMTIGGSTKLKPFIINIPQIGTIGNKTINYVAKDNSLNAIFELPKSMSSSFTVLEGNYSLGATQTDCTIYEFPDNYEDTPNYPSRLSLLDIVDNTTHPISDRLVEYLIGSVITPIDEIQYNVARLQDKIYHNRTFKGTYDIFDSNLRKELYNIATNKVNAKYNPQQKLYSSTLLDELYFGDKDIITMLNEVTTSAM